MVGVGADHEPLTTNHAFMNLTFEQFKDLAGQYNLIPLYDTLPADLDTPVSAFLKLKTDTYDFLFESVVGGEKWARYSFLGTQPRKIYRLIDGKFEITDVKARKILKNAATDPLETLRMEFDRFQVYQDHKLPRFFGGAVGYFGYDLIRYFEDITLKNPKNKELPDLFLILTDSVVIFDNLEQKMMIVHSVFVPRSAGKSASLLHHLYDEAAKKITAIKEKLQLNLEHPYPFDRVPVTRKAQSMDRGRFCKIVEKAREYIKAGEIFQVVLSLRFELEARGINPFQIYRSLRRINPSPYMYYLGFGDLAIVGASPEVLVRLEEGVVEVRPIAGTRKRGKSHQRDLALEKELLSDPKEQAEHVMLLDLGRNDIGRVAQTGTVTVVEKEVVERYSHVMHLVSHVSGRLAADKDVFDVIQATFPAGTLSGAPKIRAMQIIEELEAHARGIYGGAVGYISFTKNTDLAITIRTAVVHEGIVTVQAGAGIVYNSVPELEYKECQNKARSVMAAIAESVKDKTKNNVRPKTKVGGRADVGH